MRAQNSDSRRKRWKGSQYEQEWGFWKSWETSKKRQRPREGKREPSESRK